jgi:hypothetical protein
MPKASLYSQFAHVMPFVSIASTILR